MESIHAPLSRLSGKRKLADIVDYMKREQVFAQIVEEGYAELPCESIAGVVGAAERGFTHFLYDESDERREYFRAHSSEYPIDELGDELEFGFLETRKGGKKATLSALESAEGRHTYDANKERFHNSSALIAYLRVVHPEIADELIEAHWKFLSAGARLNMMAQLYASGIAAVFDEMNAERLGGCYPGSMLSRVSLGSSVTRHLSYRPLGDDPAPDAQVHRDRSCWTFHWRSSHRGLVLFDHAKMPVRPDETSCENLLVFPGTKFWSITRGKFGTGALHGVKSMRGAEDRHATVSFEHPYLTREDVLWHRAHQGALRFDPAEFPLS